MGMFDFNGDGHTDSGEQFTGYQIYKDVTGSNDSDSFRPRGGKKIDGFTIFLIVLFGWQILTFLCKL